MTVPNQNLMFVCVLLLLGYGNPIISLCSVLIFFLSFFVFVCLFVVIVVVLGGGWLALVGLFVLFFFRGD